MLDELLCKLLNIFNYKQYKVHETRVSFPHGNNCTSILVHRIPFLILQLSQKYAGILVAMYKNL